MRRTALVLVCLWASVAGMAGPRPCEVRAADPPKVAAAEPATIDQLMKQLADLRAQKAEIEKREKATLAELKERLQLLRDLLKDLDLEPAPSPIPKPPDPAPKPDPEPPTPTAAKVVVVVVEETGQRTPAQGAVLFDRGVRDRLTAGGHQVEVADRNDPAVSTAGYLPHVERVGVPAVLVFDAAKIGPQVPLRAFRLPATAAAFESEVLKAVKK